MANFRTRARALDLLGRQQIAGIPTAINELIKNAHDAYADNFDIDYLRNKDLLVLRDDGLGMTRSEFENRWLTIGTESKLKNSKTTPPPIDPDKPLRHIMGEKGIGRLAIASIGKQVLILTRATNRGTGNYVVSFINWEIFELPNINLEDIIIPVKEFACLPDSTDINQMKSEVIASLNNLLEKSLIEDGDYQRIVQTIKSFDVNPRILDESLPSIHKLNTHSGTQFYISPVSDMLPSDIEGDSSFDSAKEATKIEKILMGFHNTMTPNHPAPTVQISFRDYRKGDDSFVDIINEDQFFTPDEFELADHHFIGDFDEFGQFKGQIKIYGEKTYNHVVTWRDNNFRQTSCGPFSINLAYLQGELKSSKVSPEDYSIIRAKGDKFGGLYIYRDNIRILPYGDSDYDFLDIEKNRSKRASSYFFSYRRMFGVIVLSSEHSKGLVEKAGREGFIENKAYRQLQSILKNFFVQLAADFFNEKGSTVQSEYWNSKKEELNSYYKALERRDKLAKSKKEKFTKALKNFFEDLTSGMFESKLRQIISDFTSELEQIIHIPDPDIAAQRMINAEAEVRKAITEYKKKISVPSPKGFSLTKALRTDFYTYLDEYKILRDTLFLTAFQEIDELIDLYTQQLDIVISKRKRLEQAVDLISSEALSFNRRKKEEANDLASSIAKKVRELTTQLMLDLDAQIRDVKSQFVHLTTAHSDNFDLVTERTRMEAEIDSVSQRNTMVMDRIIRQFESFYIEKDEDGNIITPDQVSDAMAEELDDLRNRLQSDVELSQLGLAVGILHHEFNSTVSSIRRSLKDLKAWSDVDIKLETTYKNLKVNFEHLDGYLNLFTPLNRRLNRIREDIPLLDIKSFTLDLFKSRFERHNIQLRHTNGFAQGSIYGFRSTFYPVFVNIIDNAIYWLKQSDNNDKIIRLHADESGIYISNNGPCVQPQDKERIFELRFSRKPSGRGLGLSVSREVLEAEDYHLFLDSPRKDSTVTFKISKNSHE